MEQLIRPIDRNKSIAGGCKREAFEVLLTHLQHRHLLARLHVPDVQERTGFGGKKGTVG